MRRNPARCFSWSRCPSAAWQAIREAELAPVEESLARVLALRRVKERREPMKCRAAKTRRRNAETQAERDQQGRELLVAALSLLEDNAFSRGG